jgi:hypothetical protein
MTDKKDLEARIAELERAAKPPEPYVDDWVVPPPAIDRVSMSPSTMLEFAQAVPDDVVRGIARDARAPSGPSSQGVIPSSQQMSNVRTGGGGRGTGWAREVPLSNPPGIGWVDALCEVDAAKQRGVRMVEEAKLKAAEPK